MAPKSCQESEDEQVSPAPAGVKPDHSDVEYPVGTAVDTVAPSCSQGSKPYCESIPMGCSVKQQLAPEALDPRTLRLLWDQRELEIQALRWAVQNSQNARRYHILQEVAGIPPERNSKSQDKFLQNQVQKLTLELKAQKEQAQLEKEQLEEKLRQNVCAMQQLEAELQTFQKSCLLQLARSSWVGRVIRSQTGSVEVVTAEALRDPTDSSDYVEVPTAGEGFRLEDVDWNSIAHRYPNLFSNMSFQSDQKLPQPHQSSEMDSWDSECAIKHMEKPSKVLEWSALPLVDNSSSEGADSDSSSYQIVLHSGAKKVAGHPLQKTDLASSEQIPECTGSFSGQTEGLIFLDLHKIRSPSINKTVLELHEDPHHQLARPQLNPLGCCLKIAAVSHRDKFIRILNQSQAETVDLGGFVLQQLVRDFPVCMYRFPLGTLLAPQHHITVWGEGTSRTKKQLVSSGQDPFHFQSSRGCVTVLVNPLGQVLSEHQDAPSVTLGSKIFTDNTDWSIDRFPLSESEPNADPGEEQQRPLSPRKGKGRVRDAGARRKKRGPSVRQQWLSHTSTSGLRTSGSLRVAETRDILPVLSTRKLLHPGDIPAQQEGLKTETAELLPAIPECASRVCLEDSLGRQEHKFQVCRKSVDLSCPMVALSVQSTAESRYGFRFLCYPPITEDLYRRL